MRTGIDGLIPAIVDQNLNQILRLIQTSVDGKLEFQTNFRVALIKNFEFKQANFSYLLEHKLGSIPIGYLVIAQNTYGVFKRGSANWTENVIYVQCNTANTRADVLIIGG